MNNYPFEHWRKESNDDDVDVDFAEKYSRFDGQTDCNQMEFIRFLSFSFHLRSLFFLFFIYFDFHFRRLTKQRRNAKCSKVIIINLYQFSFNLRTKNDSFFVWNLFKKKKSEKLERKTNVPKISIIITNDDDENEVRCTTRKTAN